MTINAHEFRINVRPADRAREAFGSLRIAARSDVALSGAVIDEAHGPDLSLPRGESVASPRGIGDGWTPAHAEAARFLGQCFAVGAVLGVVTELALPLRNKRQG